MSAVVGRDGAFSFVDGSSSVLQGNQGGNQGRNDHGARSNGPNLIMSQADLPPAIIVIKI